MSERINKASSYSYELVLALFAMILSIPADAQYSLVETQYGLLAMQRIDPTSGHTQKSFLNEVTNPTVTDTVTEAWARHYGPDSLAKASAITVDSDGNVYVTGWSYSPASLRDYATIKYDPSGNVQWIALYNGPGGGLDEAAAIAVDESGNVYVTGRSVGSGFNHYDYATLKYDSEGNELWAGRYNGAGNFWDEAVAIAVDAAGNVYVTGSSFGASNYWVYSTIKYSPLGIEQWAAHYGGLGFLDNFAADIVLDSSGNIYVTGTSAGDWATIKYSSQGIQQWVSRYNGPATSDDEAHALALDATGNIYVAGWSTGSGTSSDYTIIKYDDSGIEQWVSRYNGPGNSIDYAYAMSVDLFGNAYVTGESFDTATNTDYATVKYNDSGEEQWVARYNGPANAWDVARAIAVDAWGNVYVTGRSYGNYYDFATLKYNPAGNQLWTARYGAPGSFDNTATAIAVHETGSVYVTGWSEVVYAIVEIGSIYTTIKYDQDPVAIEEKKQTQPVSFFLNQNYPNPFNSSTIISYDLPVSTYVTLSIFDLLGREVQNLVDGHQSAGSYRVEFARPGLASGVYLYRIEAGEFVKTKKLLLLR